ncbi:MAG: ATP-binding protein [Roseovarius sp.]
MFLLISVVLVVSMVTGVLQLRKLDRVSESLTQSSIPFFIETADLERSLRDLILLLQKADISTQISDMDTLDIQMTQQHALLRDAAGKLHPDDFENVDGPSVSNSLRAIERSSDQILASKRQLILLETLMAQLTQKLLKNRDRTRDLLELQTFDIAANLEREFSGEPTNGSAATFTLDQRYYQSLIRANAITELTLVIEAIVDAAAGLDKITSEDELQLLESNLSFKLRGSVLLMSRLPQSETRIKLASEISRLRTLIFEAEGMFDVALNRLAETRRFNEFRQSQTKPIQDISTLSREAVQSAKNNVGLASRSVHKSSNGLILNLIIAGAVSLFTMVCAVVFVVERQINKRMAKLTHAVLAIAEGETDHKVQVHGPDELGKMARALEVFKSNAEELHRSNVELEKFAYVAAHDLRSPLRAIQDLSEWVLEDPDTSFSNDGREYMALLQQRIERLNKLLSDLLEYSRVGKEQDDIISISVRDIVEDTKELLDPEGHFNIQYTGSDVEVETYGTPLRHIILNLINNAIKHHDDVTGTVEVHAELIFDKLTCTVRDDGPGIAPQYHDRIFNLFQTLRPRDEVEGSGFGLAIIRKLLEHHGGSITVRSDPKTLRGTTFTFVLPEASTTVKPLPHAA